MINSLRVVGHDEPVFVLDCGLTPSSASCSSREATIVDAPAREQPFAAQDDRPARHPAEVMVLIDADMIVTRPLSNT